MVITGLEYLNGFANGAPLPGLSESYREEIAMRPPVNLLAHVFQVSGSLAAIPTLVTTLVDIWQVNSLRS